MVRKLVVFASVVLACSAISAGVVHASPTPPHGSFGCWLTGSVRLKPALPGAGQPPVQQHLHTKILKGAGTGCTNAGVTGGKAPITGAVVNLNGVSDRNVNCADLATVIQNLNQETQLQIKLTNTTAGVTSTVAVLKPRVDIVTLQLDEITIEGGIPPNPVGNKPFANASVLLTLKIDNTADVDACQAAGSTTPLTHIDFSEAGGSTLYVSG